MVWGLFLLIYGEQVRQGFTTHMIATYETVEECNKEAHKYYRAGQDVDREKFTYTLKSPRYRCIPIPKQ